MSFGFQKTFGAIFVAALLTSTPVWAWDPVANNDSYSTDQNMVLTVSAPGVLANDTDVDGQSLTAILLSNPSHGTLTFNANGSFTYRPATNYNGPDSFTYKASDGARVSAAATVNITVRPQPIVVTTPPKNQTNCPGSTVTFSVTATGPGLKYQWLRGTTVLAGKTNSTLTLANITLADAGTYSVKLTSGSTSVTNSATLTVRTLVSATPLVNLVRAVGANAVFSTVASGTGPFTYVWKKNGAIISGQTASSLVLNNLNTNATAAYSVVVSGPCNSVTSSATLMVDTCFPSVDVMLVIDRSGSMLGQPYRDAKTAASNFVNNLKFGTNSDLAGLVSYNATATLDQRLTNSLSALRQAIDGILGADGYTSISSGLQTAQNEMASIRHNPDALPVIVLLSDGMPTGGDTPANARAAATAAKNAGSRIFTVGLGDVDHALMADIASSTNDYYYTTNSSQLTALFNAISTVICRPPTNIFLTGPSNLTVCVGATATFSVSVTGCMAFRFQWSKDGVNLPGRTNSTLVLNNVVATNGGTYAVAVLSDCQNRTNSATLTVNQPALVVTAPQNQSSFIGSNANFSVNATGTGLTYQWFFNGAVVGTSSTLALNNLTTSQAGIYCAVVKGLCGGPVTNCATLTFLNRQPVANPDSYTVVEDSLLTVSAPGVLANDIDPDGNPLTSILLSNVTHGALTLNANGSFTYRPATNYTGSDTFTYRANDGVTNSAPATVTITVTAVNDAPVARDDAYSTPADAALTVAAPGVLLNDSDVENNPLSALLVSNPTHGTVTLNAGGSFNYVPNTNYSGLDIFTYKASDGSATSGVATVTITVVPAGVVIVVPPVNQTNCPGATATFSVTATGTALTYQWLFGTNALPGATNRTLVLTNIAANNAGLYCVTVTAATNAPITRCATLIVNQNVIVTTPPANQTACPNSTVLFQVGATGTGLTYQWYFGANLLSGQTGPSLVLSNVLASQAGTYRMVVSGACGAPVTNSVTLTVNPVVAITSPPASQTSFVGSNIVFSVGATGTNLRYQWSFNGSVIGTNSTLTLNNLTTNQAGTYCVVVSGTCGSPRTNCVTLTIQNRAPIARDDSYTTTEDTILTVTVPGVLANDSDVDGDALTTLVVNNPTHGTLTLNTNGGFVYRPNTNYNGMDTFTYRATDGGLFSAPATVTLVVTPVNDPPTTGVAGDLYSTLEDQSLSVPAPGVLANDSDIDGDPLTAIIVSGPTNGTLVLNANGSFVYTPTSNYFGPDTFTYVANDGRANSVPAVVRLTVQPVNDAPSFVGSGNQRVNQNASAQSVVWATEISAGPPNESNQTVTFTVTNDRSDLFLVPPSVSPNGTLTYTPATNLFGVATVHVTARDNGGTANGGVDTSGKTTFTITINSPPSVQIISPEDGTVLISPATFSVLADATDPDGTVTNVLFLLNGTAFVDVAQSPFYFVMTNAGPGNYQFRAVASDDFGLSATSAVVNVTVVTNTIILAGPIALNHQNGLFEQFATISNSTSQTWLNGVRLSVLNLDSPNHVYNATGTNANGTPHIDYTNAVPPRGLVTIIVQYYVPNPRVVTIPILVATPLPFPQSLAPKIVQIVPAADGTLQIRFTTQDARYYFLQYSEDLVHWKTGPTRMLGTGAITIAPGAKGGGKCFYRVLLIP